LLAQPAIAVYYFAYKTLTTPNDETYFDRLEQLIQKHEQEFTQSEFRTIYVAAVNYCIPKITQGRRDFAERAFKLYTKGLERGVLFENGLLSRYTFGNAVAFAIRVEEFAWAEKFVEENKKYLEEKLRNSIGNIVKPKSCCVNLNMTICTSTSSPKPCSSRSTLKQMNTMPLNPCWKACVSI
jgi:hypothetical protein